MIKLALLLAGLVVAILPGPARIDDLAWLAGCWERTGGDGVYEEQWMAPRAGMMLGMSRTVRAAKVIAFEQMRMYERGDSLVFASLPSGQPPAEFVAAAATAGAVTFSNPAHDFPQRVIYAPGTADSLFARIEGTMNGQQRGMDFRMKRTVCASAAPITPAKQ